MFGWVLLIIALVSFIVILTVIKNEVENKEDWIEDSFVLSIIITFIFAVILFIAGLVFDYEIYEKEKVDIYSVNSDSKVNNLFTLGFGNKGEESYFYYIEGKDEIESIKKINTADTKLIEDNVEQPYIIKYDSKYKSGFAKWLYGEEALTFEGYKYELHIPEDTATTEFNIDLDK